MSARQSKKEDKERIHVVVGKKKLKVIDKAAEGLGLSRSHYIATVAFAAAEQAVADLAAKGK